MADTTRKNLILFTSSFPCGSDEVFLENEFPFLENNFNKIIIITSSKLPVKNNYKSDKIEVIKLYKKVPFLKKIFFLVQTLFSRIYRDELNAIKNEFQLKPNIDIYKTLLSASILKKYIANKMEKLITERGLKSSETVLYSYWFDEFAFAEASLKNKYPELMCICRAHGWDVYFERHSNNYLPLRKYTLKSLDHCYIVSNFGVEYLNFKIKGISSKVSCSKLGTPIIEDNVKLKNDFFHLVSCSSIIRLKRVDRIIQSLSLIKDINIHWTHFGTGDLENSIITLANKNLNDKTNITYEFKGSQSNKEIIEFYQKNQVDLFINCSETEGIPVSIMEALSCGIPCIAPNVGGISEIVNENVGELLSSTPNDLEICRAIEKFATLNHEQKEIFRKNSKLFHKDNYNADSNFNAFVNQISRKKLIPKFQECTRCLYNNHTYPSISFDSMGVCNICHIYEELKHKTVFKGAAGAQKISKLLNDIKKDGNNKKYDCIIGVSGGVDSSYVAYLSKEWGLKPFVIHVDNGWNSDTSVKNIDRLLKRLDLELHTHVINWQEMKDLQRSFVKASVVDIDLPFDNAFMAILYRYANKLGIKYILSGHNTETEGWMPDNFTHYKLDVMNIKNIHQRFGKAKISNFPLMGPLKSWYYKKWKKIEMVSPIDYIDYNKNKVKQFLINDFEWVDYGGKHYENLFTRFYQSYILYHKFGIDKRISHLSTLINSGQISKENAQEELKKLPYLKDSIQNEKAFFIKKLGFSEQEFDKYIDEPAVQHIYYKSYLNLFRKIKSVRDFILIR